MTGLTYSPECSDSEAPGPDSYVLMSTLLNMGGDRGGGAGVCLRSCDGMFWSHCNGSFFKAVIDSHHGVNKPFKLSWDLCRICGIQELIPSLTVLNTKILV